MPLVIPTLRDSAGYLTSGLYAARGLDFVVAVICLFLAFVVRGSVQRRRGYPPGPLGWPIIGNALQLPSRKHWLKFDEWSKKYGDVFQFSSLGEKTIVLGSAAAVSELFDTRGEAYSDRPSAIMAGELAGWNLGLGYANYDLSSPHTATPESPHPVHSNDRFRALRKLFHNTIGPQACSQSAFVTMQEQERTKLLHRLLITGKQYPAGSDFGDPIRQSSAALILRLTYGYQPSSDNHEHDKLVQIVNDAMLGFSVASEPGAFWVEYWPFLRHVPTWVPGAGFQSKAKQMKEDREKLYDIPFLYTKHQKLRNLAPKSMVSTLLSSKSPTRDEELIKAAAASLYSGGAETTPSTLLSFLLAMLMYPNVQTRAQAELDALLDPPDASSSRLPTLDDRPRLPYVNALIKEVWRWNPSVPLGTNHHIWTTVRIDVINSPGLAHRVTKNDIYNGFFIEKGATLYANIWSILHNEGTYYSPHEFMPERFLDDAGALRTLDKMEDPSWTAFGFGRRICPGMHLADNSIFIYIASILHIFRIVKAVDDEGVEIEPDVDYDGFISQPKPFKCRLVPRSEAAEQLVLRTIREIEASAGSDDDSPGGHEIVATIAQIHLHPSVLPLLCSILYPDSFSDTCYLAPASTWADRLKYRMRWSAPLHYVGAVGDHPSDTCIFPGDKGWAGHDGGNVLSAIRNVTTILEDFVQDTAAAQASASARLRWSANVDKAEEALKFLIHFVGDMHQPLHLTGRDRGGNGDKVSWDGRVTNLHSLWDGLLIAKALRGIPHSSNYSRPLPVPAVEAALRGAIYDPYIRKLMWEGVGVGNALKARWEDDVEGWLDCPDSSKSRSAGWLAQLGQAVLDVFPLRQPAQETDDDTLCPYAWAVPIHKLNCDLVWPKELDEPPYGHAAYEEYDHDHDEFECRGSRVATRRCANCFGLDTPEYAGRIEKEWVVEHLLALGGIRLAGVLNGIFAPLIEDGAVPAKY
ncbi:hypothetical protein EVG20_g7406 [Dentipellis fragilis]|uniref:Phospholipase C/P1 nuclease n=1 Tax=Dentipellis fragilis TaxID=205917 RepID=A0A4Y9YG90_9AGAM|nr:hypothetical protein EVG20_g7406 [Dentipellis fragilis]